MGTESKGAKQLKSDFCNYSAPYESSLIRHTRKHTNEKPSKCKVRANGYTPASVQKEKLWMACKKIANKSKLVEDALVFAKQTNYAPWPSTIISINKSRTSAMVKYHGFENYRGKVKFNELVQVDETSMKAIESLIGYTLKTKSIKEFNHFKRAIRKLYPQLLHTLVH